VEGPQEQGADTRRQHNLQQRIARAKPAPAERFPANEGGLVSTVLMVSHHPLVPPDLFCVGDGLGEGDAPPRLPLAGALGVPALGPAAPPEADGVAAAPAGVEGLAAAAAAGGVALAPAPDGDEGEAG